MKKDKIAILVKQFKDTATDYIQSDQLEIGMKFTRAAQLLEEWQQGGMVGEIPIKFDDLPGDWQDPVSEEQISNPPEGVERLSDRFQGNTNKPPEIPIQSYQRNLYSGLELPGNKARYRLERSLGGGKYSDVWEASVIQAEILINQQPISRVALKIMRPNLIPEEKRMFRSETEILVRLRRYEKQHGLRVNDHSLIPTVFDQVSEYDAPDGRAFFVQTLANGTPVDQLVRGRGALPEQNALTITEQFCRVLECLHEGIKRSYLDFQPRNIFWDAEKRQIMVIDWNLLSDPRRMDVDGDLLAAGKLLYRLLMGVPAPQPGQRRMLAQPIEAWGKISPGSQDILAKALHPSKRYPDAQSFRSKIEEISHMWLKSPEDILGDVQDVGFQLNLDERLNQSQVQLVRRAVRALGVLEKHPDANELLLDDVRQQRAVMTSWMTGRGELETGKRHFRAMGFEEAERFFLEAIEVAWNSATALEATRWLFVTRAAAQKESKQKDLEANKAIQGLVSFDKEAYNDAKNIFVCLKQQSSRDVLDYLIMDANYWIHLIDAGDFEDNREFRRAADALRSAVDVWESLPAEYKTLLEEISGDVEVLARDMEQQAEEYEKVDQALVSVAQAFEGSFDKGYDSLKTEFDARPGQPRLIEFVEEKAKDLIVRRNYGKARAISALGLDYAPGTDGLNKLWEGADYFSRAWHAWQSGDMATFRDDICYIHDSADIEGYKKELLRICVTEAQDRGDYFRLRFLLALLPQDDIARPGEELMEALRKTYLDHLKTQVVESIDTLLSGLRKAGLQYVNDSKFSKLHRELIGWCMQQRWYSRAAQIASFLVEVDELFLASGKLAKELDSIWVVWQVNGAIELKNAVQKAELSPEDEAALAHCLGGCFEDAKSQGDFLAASVIRDLIPPENDTYHFIDPDFIILREEFYTKLEKDFEINPEMGLERLSDYYNQYAPNAYLDELMCELMHNLLIDEGREKHSKLLAEFIQSLGEGKISRDLYMFATGTVEIANILLQDKYGDYEFDRMYELNDRLKEIMNRMNLGRHVEELPND